MKMEYRGKLNEARRFQANDARRMDELALKMRGFDDVEVEQLVGESNRTQRRTFEDENVIVVEVGELLSAQRFAAPPPDTARGSKQWAPGRRREPAGILHRDAAAALVLTFLPMERELSPSAV